MRDVLVVLAVYTDSFGLGADVSLTNTFFEISVNIHPLVVCSLLGEHVDHLVGADRFLVRTEKADGSGLGPDKIVAKPGRIGINEFSTETGSAEHDDGRAVVAGEPLDLFPESHQVYLDVPRTSRVGGTFGIASKRRRSLLLRQASVRQITHEAVNRFGGQVLHLFQAVAV